MYKIVLFMQASLESLYRWCISALLSREFAHACTSNVNVVCCVGRVEIQIQIWKGRCTAKKVGKY